MIRQGTRLIQYLIILLTFTILQTYPSFAADKSVSTFKNRSPQSTSSSPTQTTPANQPKLSDRTIGALPAIKFNGSAQYLNYNGAPLAGKDYTIFVVEQRTAAVGAGGSYFFGTSTVGPAANVGLILGYKTDTQLVFSQGSNEEIIAIEPYSAGAKPVIHTFVQDSANGKKYYRNGALVFSNGSNTTPLVSNNNAFIGLNETNKYYQGNVAEVAVYKRAISVDEISNIHGYLLDKWDVTVTNDGTACLGTSTPHSPGYVTVTDGVWPDAANGGSSSIDCSPLGKVGTINDMLCTNGVWSGGDGGGSCGFAPCSDANPDAHVTYGSAALTNSGTWGGATGTIAHNSTVTATCPGGPLGATPTLTCNNGTFNWNSGTCSPNCSDLDVATNFPLTNNGTWDSTTALNGDTITATCPNGHSGTLPTLTCNSGVLSSNNESCLTPCGDPTAEFPNVNGGTWITYEPMRWPDVGYFAVGACPLGSGGHKTVMCNADGTYSNFNYQCTPANPGCPALLLFTGDNKGLSGSHALSSGAVLNSCTKVDLGYILCCPDGKYATPGDKGIPWVSGAYINRFNRQSPWASAFHTRTQVQGTASDCSDQVALCSL